MYSDEEWEIVAEWCEENGMKCEDNKKIVAFWAEMDEQHSAIVDSLITVDYNEDKDALE